MAYITQYKGRYSNNTWGQEFFNRYYVECEANMLGFRVLYMIRILWRKA